MVRAILGLDIGGANLKAAHTSGAALSRPFALWRQPASLSRALAALVRDCPAADEWAITMTGELCDCFASKREGVRHILDAVAEAAGPTPVAVWRTDGRFADLAAARLDNPLDVAAANWLALAAWAGRLVPSGPALLIDIGTTTTDIIPLQDGKPIPAGRTDPERLRQGELVYTGVRRTPVCALGGGNSQLAAEWFATTQDVYLVLGLLAEDPSDTDTADGRPATIACAHARLARMLCADLETSSSDERLALAREVEHRQVHMIRRAIGAVTRRLSGPPETVVRAGCGEFLARAACAGLDARCISLSSSLGVALSQAACAHAVAILRQGVS
jgi:probable H4MPT-linked C1 transfer pathway protein